MTYIEPRITHTVTERCAWPVPLDERTGVASIADIQNAQASAAKLATEKGIDTSRDDWLYLQPRTGELVFYFEYQVPAVPQQDRLADFQNWVIAAASIEDELTVGRMISQFTDQERAVQDPHSPPPRRTAPPPRRTAPPPRRTAPPPRRTAVAALREDTAGGGEHDTPVAEG